MEIPMMLDPRRDPISLTQDFVDIPSESQDETAIADAVERGFRTIVQTDHPTVTVDRIGNCVVARTHRGLPTRVVLAGHLDTVPIAENVPSLRAPGDQGPDCIHGCGSVDMKSGDAVFYHLFYALADDPGLQQDMTLVYYDCEEIDARFNGLRTLQRDYPELIRGDISILGEPSGGWIEAGCQGTMRIRIEGHGVRAHSARAWMGENSIHALSPVLAKLAAYEIREVEIDGCVYREGLNAVRMAGGIAGNVIPDEAWVEVNFRFAPDRTEYEALGYVCDTLGLSLEGITDTVAGTRQDAVTHGLTWEILDMSGGALPGLSAPAATPLVAAANGKVRAKYGWTDVSRFAAMGMPSVNLGPGDPSLAHKRDEHCPVKHITEVTEIMRIYLTTPSEKE